MLLAFATSVATAIYWWIVFFVAYADVLFAGDRNPSAPPIPDRTQTTHAALSIMIGVIVYAGMILLWRGWPVTKRKPTRNGR